MLAAPLRGAEGLRPFARSNAFAASRLTLARYPFRKVSNDFQCAEKVAALNPHDEIEYITASATAEAMENLFSRVNVERWMTFAVEGTETEELAPRLAKPCEPASERNQVNTPFQITCVQRFAARWAKIISEQRLPDVCLRPLPSIRSCESLRLCGYSRAQRKGRAYSWRELPRSDTSFSSSTSVRTPFNRHATQNRPIRMDFCQRRWPLARLQPQRVRCSRT